MKYKVGDVVYVKSENEIKRLLAELYRSPGWNEDMFFYCGKKFEIKSVDFYYRLGISWAWDDWMLEDTKYNRYKKLRKLYAKVL